MILSEDHKLFQKSLFGSPMSTNFGTIKFRNENSERQKGDENHDPQSRMAKYVRQSDINGDKVRYPRWMDRAIPEPRVLNIPTTPSSPSTFLTPIIGVLINGSLLFLTTLTLLLFLSSVPKGCGVIEDDFSIKTSKGRIQGVRLLTPTLKPVAAFLGIPFAKVPVGDLRFKHPVPREPWVGTVNATRFQHSCYQIFDTLFGNFSGSQMWNPNTPLSEDCLYLNIWVPYRAELTSRTVGGGPLPVMIWIFGGGFYSGTASLDVYDGAVLASETNVVVASMNYRVGSLGFLYLRSGEAPGNAGLYDQRLAMQWIYDNVAEFGGDPGRVTLFGESAGAASVDMHLLSPGSWRYFDRAILQSGSATNYWSTIPPGEAVKRGLRLAEGLDCPLPETTATSKSPSPSAAPHNGPAPDGEDRRNDRRDILRATMECLRSADPWDIVTHDWVTTEYMKFPFVPVVDGLWFEEAPSELVTKRHRLKKGPGFAILVGTNRDEGTYFNIYQLPNLFLPLDKDMDGDGSLTRSAYDKALPDLFPQFNKLGHRAIAFEYTDWESTRAEERVGAVLEAFDKSVGDFYFTCGVNEVALAYASAGTAVYKYYFTHRSSRNPWPPWMGVMHADEISFVFGEPLVPHKAYKPEEVVLSRTMMTFWTNFAKTGNPNIDDEGKWSEVQWPQHTPHNREYLRLSVDSHEIGKGPRIKQCAFWSEYIPDLVTATEDITEAEIQWKSQFHDWKTKYIVDWKLQFDKYMARQNMKFDKCSSSIPNNT